MKTQQEKLLECYQINYPGQNAPDVESLNGRYIPERRLMFEKMYTKELVDEVFGPATDLEKAETRLLLLETGKISNDEKYEFLIDISHYIANACSRELDSSSEIWQKYAMLYNEIPVKVIRLSEGVLDYTAFAESEETVTARQLMVATNWLITENAEKNISKKIYLEYIFELVYISLKKIFA